MSKNAAYSAAARQAVIKFLREEAGYKPFQASKFVKSGSDILPHVYLAKSRHLTQIYVGIIPLYLPSATTKLNAICLTGRYPDCVLSDLDSESQAARWVSAVVNSLRDGLLSTMEQITSPEALLRHVEQRGTIDYSIIHSENQAAELLVYSTAFLGDISGAIEHARSTREKVQKTRIDSLSQVLSKYDQQITMLKTRAADEPISSAQIAQRIIVLEKKKRLAEFDAAHNARRFVEQCDEWISALSDPHFDHEAFFSTLITQNKQRVKYDKLFP